MRRLYISIFFSILFSILMFGQVYDVPEVLYYKFNETGSDSTQNLANPGSGSAWAPVLGGLTMGPTGQFGDAVIGAGGTSSTDYVNTGWITNIGTSSWTISLWLNNLEVGVTTLRYLFGDNTASSFRCFLNGVAGTNNIALRGGGLTDIYIGPVAPGPSVVHYVYDSAIPEVRAYINGALVGSYPQAALNINGTSPFKVAGYSTSNSMATGSLMDEFRFYNRALSAQEVADTWDQTLPYVVPVELTSFTASVSGNSVTLNWETATEVNNSGFSIERKTDQTEFRQISFIPGFGTTTEPKSYSFTDENLLSGFYTYRLKQIDFDGTFEYSDEVNVEVITPAQFTLEQNYPNPFNPATRIKFSLAADSKVLITVYNMLGETVAALVNDYLPAGIHETVFNASNLNSGVYFYELDAVGSDGQNFHSVKKMTLAR